VPTNGACAGAGCRPHPTTVATTSCRMSGMTACSEVYIYSARRAQLVSCTLHGDWSVISVVVCVCVFWVWSLRNTRTTRRCTPRKVGARRSLTRRWRLPRRRSIGRPRRRLGSTVSLGVSRAFWPLVNGASTVTTCDFELCRWSSRCKSVNQGDHSSSSSRSPATDSTCTCSWCGD